MAILKSMSGEFTHPSTIGAQAEFAVASALVATGKRVYLPLMAPHSRVDLVFEDGPRFSRVQCKTSRLDGGVLKFSTCSNTRGVRKDYQGEVDFFGVFSPELGSVYLVPVEDVATRLCHLRLAPARNKQVARTRMAVEYEISPPLRPLSPAQQA